MADVAATIWAAPVLSRDFAQSPGQAAALIGGVLIIAGVVGSIMGGVAAIGVPAGLFPVMTDTTMFGVVLLILMISGTVCGLVTATAIAVLVPNEERGTCLGAFMILGTLIGMGVSPILVSMSSQFLGGEAQLALSLAIVGVGVGVGSLAMLNAPKPVPAATAAGGRRRSISRSWGAGGGQGGIRTHGRLPPTAVFKTAALNHSATCPRRGSAS